MKKHVTLIELTIAVVVIVILATIGVPLFKNVMDHSRSKVCQTNLKMLQAAIEVYGLENDVLPGSLTQLDQRHIQRAWAEVFKKENPWLIKIAYFLIDWENRGVAFAQDNFIQRYLGGNIKALTCLSDTTPPPAGFSYGLNVNLAYLPFKAYKKVKNTGEFTVVIADCEQEFFYSLNDLDYRHQKPVAGKKEEFANALVVGNSAAVVANMDGGGNFELPDQPVDGLEKSVQGGDLPAPVASVGSENTINEILTQLNVDVDSFRQQQQETISVAVSKVRSKASSTSSSSKSSKSQKHGKVGKGWFWGKSSSASSGGPSSSSGTSSGSKKTKKKWFFGWW